MWLCIMLCYVTYRLYEICAMSHNAMTHTDCVEYVAHNAMSHTDCDEICGT